jgi:ParB family transcriptional regulator, chromosome partitioning protein
MARAKTPDAPIVMMLALSQIVEHEQNPRSLFEEDSLAELAESIKTHGVLNPLQVERHDEEGGKVRFRILAGHRRFRAAQRAGLTHVPCVVQAFLEGDQAGAYELMLVEQLQHEGWHPLDEAKAYRVLMDRAGYDAKKLSDRIKKSESYVWQRLKLLDLGSYAQSTWEEEPEKLSASHAVLIARLPEDDQNEAVEAVVERSMSTRELEGWLDEKRKRPKAEKGREKAESGTKPPHTAPSQPEAKPEREWPKPNEYDVYPDSLATAFEFKTRHAEATVRVLQIHAACWIGSKSFAHHQGSHEGHSEPLSENSPRTAYAEHAVIHQARGLIEKQKGSLGRTTGVGAGNQARAAQRIIDWAEWLIERCTAEPERFPDFGEYDQASWLKQKKAQLKSPAAVHVPQDPAHESELTDEEVDRLDMERENAFLEGVKWALEKPGWCPDKCAELYERLESLFDDGQDDSAFWWERPICRLEGWSEPEDQTAGLCRAEGVGLSDDQSGTLLELLVTRLLNPKNRKLQAPAPEPDRPALEAAGAARAEEPCQTCEEPKAEACESACPGKHGLVKIGELEAGQAFSWTRAGELHLVVENTGKRVVYSEGSDSESKTCENLSMLVWPREPEQAAPEAEPQPEAAPAKPAAEKASGPDPLHVLGIEIVEHAPKAKKRSERDYDRFVLRREKDGKTAVQHIRSEDVPASDHERRALLAELVPAIDNWVQVVEG